MKNNKFDFKKLNINVNKLSEKSKSSFKTRLISAIFIFGFFILSFLFSILSDTQYHWFPVDNNSVKQLFCYFQLFLLMAISALAAREVCNLHFYKNRVALFVISFSILMTVFGIGMVFISEKFNYANNSPLNYFYILLIVALCLGIGTIIINVLYFWIQGLLEFKKIMINLILVSLVIMFAVSWLYFSDFRAWTTLLILYLITALTDVFAYVCGMLFGKKKMTPYLSPNKTIGGAIGGVVVTTIIIIILLMIFSFVPQQYNVLGNFFGIKFKYLSGWSNDNIFAGAPLWWVSVLFIIIVLSIISMVGDLSFSYIKRLYFIKDFSNLIPGHGGILDRLDSLSFTFTSYFIFSAFISLFSSSVGLF